MCGILGVINKESVDKKIFGAMLETLKHRGPESEGVWFSDDGKIALGHRRLAIIDLSPGGHQPMFSSDDRYAIVFNGEIYNYQELKTELENQGYKFRSKSDTEVLLNAYIAWGEKFLEKLNGMFSFAIWDKKEEKLFAARDRMGEKPFKYYFDGIKFIFASEIKAILKFTGVKKEVDWQAVDLALSLRYVPSPLTGLKGINKLPAGHYLAWKNGKMVIKEYWSVDNIKTNENKSLSEWQVELWDLFKDSVKKRMISDVPLGAFLSGGVDSTSVVAAVSEIQKNPIDTFVISMDGVSEDQKYARIAANFYKTNHHEIEIKDINHNQSIFDLVKLYDEPFFDQSALPSMLISREMKKFVTVVLSGDGSDELFGGYRSFQFVKFLKLYHLLPATLRKKVIPALCGAVSKNSLYKAEVLAQDFFDSYSDYYSVWKNSLPISKMYVTKQDLYKDNLNGQIDRSFVANQFGNWFGNESDAVRAAMLADIKGILADGYLTKMDLATMGSAVEVRPPFLDHRLVELTRQIPSRFKINGKTQKFIWKDLMKNKLPAEIINRPKAGFAIPLDRIIQNQLHEMIEDILLSGNGKIYEVYNEAAVRQMWKDHVNKKADYSNHLWSLLILELWIREYVK